IAVSGSVAAPDLAGVRMSRPRQSSRLSSSFSLRAKAAISGGISSSPIVFDPAMPNDGSLTGGGVTTARLAGGGVRTAALIGGGVTTAGLIGGGVTTGGALTDGVSGRGRSSQYVYLSSSKRAGGRLGNFFRSTTASLSSFRMTWPHSWKSEPFLIEQ